MEARIIQRYFKQEAQLLLRNQRDTFGGQPRSPNMVPFDRYDLYTLVWNWVVVVVVVVVDFYERITHRL